MTKFEVNGQFPFSVGDRVKLRDYTKYEFKRHKDEVTTITSINGDRVCSRWDNGDTSTLSVDGGYCFGAYKVNEGGEMKPYQRKTYRVLKDTIELKKGALVQERCDDGTQPYDCITPELIKFDATDVSYGARASVEAQPQYFIEVFKVEPEYMTREELDKWEAFKGKKKPGRKPAAKAAPATTAKRRKKRGESARRSAAAKAAWARRKAAQAA